MNVCCFQTVKQLFFTLCHLKDHQRFHLISITEMLHFMLKLVFYSTAHLLLTVSTSQTACVISCGVFHQTKFICGIRIWAVMKINRLLWFQMSKELLPCAQSEMILQYTHWHITVKWDCIIKPCVCLRNKSLNPDRTDWPAFLMSTVCLFVVRIDRVNW